MYDKHVYASQFVSVIHPPTCWSAQAPPFVSLPLAGLPVWETHASNGQQKG